ncbi:hypothetical protein [Hyphobacterium sp.]|uniref:hypothetical protein n=1 Tax=Hyphobacterium sp. TaxID=2004662 RepID=UPI003BAAAC9A
MTRKSIFGGLLAAIMMSGLAAAQNTEFGGTRYPQLQEIQTPDGQVAQFVIGQSAWGEVLSEVGLLRAEPASRDREIAERLYSVRDTIPPAFLYESARRFASFNPDQSVYVFLLARARTIYDARRCVDSTAVHGLPVMTDMAGAEVAALMNITTDGQITPRTQRMQAALDRLLSSNDIFNSTASPWWICSGSDSAYYAAANNAAMPQAEWLKGEALWPDIQQSVIRNIRENQALLAITMGTRELTEQP